MAFLKKLFQGGAKSKKKDYPNVTHGQDPLENWTKVGEIGDGAFGTVFKVGSVCLCLCVCCRVCSLTVPIMYLTSPDSRNGVDVMLYRANRLYLIKFCCF